MTDETMRQYVTAVGRLISAVQDLELVGCPEAIADFKSALVDVEGLQISAWIHAGETIDLPAPLVPAEYAVPLLGDGIPVAPAIGVDLTELADKIRAFHRRWHQLSKRGSCDSWGGAECERVMREWVEAGRPNQVVAFILKHANRPA